MSSDASIINIHPIKLSLQKYCPLARAKKHQVIDSAVSSIIETSKAYRVSPSKAAYRQVPDLLTVVQPKWKNERIWIGAYQYNPETQESGLFSGFRILVESPNISFDYFLSTDAADTLDSQVCTLIQHLNGNRVERIKLSSETGAAPLAIWDPNIWKKGVDIDVYRDHIYPMIVEYAKTILNKPNQTVLEICAGDGELARLIFDARGNRIAKYHLLELNEPSRKAAILALAPEVASEKAIIHPANIVEDDYLALTKGAQADLVLGCGALNHHVLENYPSAIQALDEIARTVKPGGALLLSGRTWMHITSVDLINRGFKVYNMTSPIPPFYQMYVAIKEDLTSSYHEIPDESLSPPSDMSTSDNFSISPSPRLDQDSSLASSSPEVQLDSPSESPLEQIPPSQNECPSVIIDILDDIDAD